MMDEARKYNIFLNSSPKQGAVNVKGKSPHGLWQSAKSSPALPTAG